MLDTRLTEPNARPANPEPSLSSLVTGIIHDAQELIKQEVALARQEFKQELAKTKEVAISFAAGAVVAGLAVVFLLTAVAFLITWVSDGHIPLWGSFGIVGLVLAVVGGILLYTGRNRAEDIHLIPRQTVETMRENVQWIKTQT